VDDSCLLAGNGLPLCPRTTVLATISAELPTVFLYDKIGLRVGIDGNKPYQDDENAEGMRSRRAEADLIRP